MSSNNPLIIRETMSAMLDKMSEIEVLSWLRNASGTTLQTVLQQYDLNENGTVEEQRDRVYRFYQRTYLNRAVLLNRVSKDRDDGDSKMTNVKERKINYISAMFRELQCSIKPTRLGSSLSTAATSGGAMLRRPYSKPAPPLYDANIQNKTTDRRNMIRSWNVKFAGGDDRDVQEFLCRIAEMRAGTEIQDQDLFNALPDLLTGMALEWYRLERHSWHSWCQFVSELKERYSDATFQVKIRLEISQCFQGDKESILDFVTRFRAILRHLCPPLQQDKELDLIYQKLRPDYHRKFLRNDFSSFHELENLGKFCDLEFKFRPLLQQTSSVPQCAKKKKKKKKKKKAAIINDTEKLSDETVNR